MTPKEFLSRAQLYDRKLNLIRMKLEKLRSILEYHSPDFDTSGHSSCPDRITASVAKIMEYEKAAKQLSEEYIKIYTDIEKAIRAIPDPTLSEVLERRYLLYQKWEEIAAEMHYSLRTVYHYHGKALLLIAEMISKN